MGRAQEVAVELAGWRNAVQAALGHAAMAVDRAKEAHRLAADALGGTANPVALEALSRFVWASEMYDRLLSKLTEADDLIARYIGVVDPGSAASTPSTAVATVTGGEIVRRSGDAGSRRRRNTPGATFSLRPALPPRRRCPTSRAKRPGSSRSRSGRR